MKNDVGRVDQLPVVAVAGVQVRDQLGEPDRVDLVDALAAGVVADLGRVTGDGEDVPHALGMTAQQERLEAHHRIVARR